MKVQAGLDACEGYANCVMAAPDVFSIDDEGVVVVLDEQPAEEQRSTVEEAVRSCPVLALTIVEG
ncbi:MAG: ferredoxin [Nocardioidaceae bacterium]